MKRANWLIPAFGALALGLGVHFGMNRYGLNDFGGVALTPVRREETADEKRIAAALADLRRELTAVKSEIADVRATIAAGSTPRGTRSRTEAKQADSAMAGGTLARNARARTAEETAKLQEARFEAIESGFRTEPTDDAWAAKVTELVKSAVAEKTAEGNDLRELECRSTVCRVEVFHRSMSAKSGFLQMFALKVGSELPEMTLQPDQAEDGTSISRIYLARSGHELPPLNPDNQPE